MNSEIWSMSCRSFAIVASILLLLSDRTAQAWQANQPALPRNTAARTTPLSPAEALRQFVVPDDLRIDQVLAEPAVAQPVSITFDERGRMWVMQYLQYPAPAGLTAVSHDKF